MSVSAAEQAQSGPVQDANQGRYRISEEVSSRTLRYLTAPVFIVLVCTALYVYLSGLELDSIEQRFINWDFISLAIVEHLQLTAVATLLIVALAVPLGVFLTRPGAKRLTPAFIGLANVGQAVPSVGLLVLLALVYKIGFQSAIIALVVYGLLPVLRNTMVGLQQLDQSIIEAGRGMGMGKMRVLLRIELPLAVPVILAGIRTALVIAVGTATLAALTNAGGLGRLINQGFAQGRVETIGLAGGVLAAALALLVDWLAGIAEDLLRPKGL